MGRLIDADKCPCILCEDTRNAHCTYEHRSCKKFCDWLNNTAYDVEKVVAELEKEKEIHTEHYNISLYKDYPEVKQRYEQIQLVIDDAIAKVRKGGVE